MALTDIVVAQARALYKDSWGYAIYRRWVEQLEESYGFLESGKDSEKLAFALIALTERYGNNMYGMKELRELTGSLVSGRYRVLVPLSSKTELPRREWMILFAATQIAHRL